MPMPHVETPVAAELAPPLEGRRLLTGRDVRNYLLQLVSLAIFFGCGLVVTLVAPFIRVALGRTRSRRVGRRMVRSLFAFFEWWLQRMNLFRIRYEGCERLADLRGAIIAANHPGILDAVFLVPRIPRVVCIMRARLMHNLSFAGAAWLAGYITNDRGSSLIRKCCKTLSVGDNLLIFPEGTRTRASACGVNPFKSGFALAASMSGAPIHTIFIERSGVYLGKETSLAAAARIPIDVTIRRGASFRAKPGESAKELSARLEDYFRANLANTDDGVRLRH